MAINNMMPPVQLKRPAAPVTDINKMIEDLNLQLTTPTVQQAAPQSTANVAEILKQQIADKLNEKIQSLTQGASLEEVTGAQAPRPQPPRSNLSRLRDESPIHGSTSAATTAFAKTAQTMNNIKAINEQQNDAREFQKYRDDVDINKMIERLDMKNQYDRALESDRAQNRTALQDAAFEDRMALLNARLESKGGGSGRGPGRPAGTGNGAAKPNLSETDQTIYDNIKSLALDFQRTATEENNLISDEEAEAMAANELSRRAKNVAERTAYGRVYREKIVGQKQPVDKEYSGGGKWTTDKDGKRIFVEGAKTYSPKTYNENATLAEDEAAHILKQAKIQGRELTPEENKTVTDLQNEAADYRIKAKTLLKGGGSSTAPNSGGSSYIDELRNKAKK